MSRDLHEGERWGNYPRDREGVSVPFALARSARGRVRGAPQSVGTRVVHYTAEEAPIRVRPIPMTASFLPPTFTFWVMFSTQWLFSFFTSTGGLSSSFLGTWNNSQTAGWPVLLARRLILTSFSGSILAAPSSFLAGTRRRNSLPGAVPMWSPSIGCRPRRKV